MSAATGGEGVLEAEEVEEVVGARAIAIGVKGGSGELILKAQEIEKVELAAAITIRVAGANAPPAGNILNRYSAEAAGLGELAGDIESRAGSVVKGGHGVHAYAGSLVQPAIKVVPLAAIPSRDAPNQLPIGMVKSATGVQSRAGSVVEDMQGADGVVRAGAE